MPTTCYIEILAVQRPFPVTEDENNRTLFSVNFLATSHGAVSEWEEDVVRICVTAGVPLVLDVDTFIGRKKVPDGAGPFTSVIDTGGTAPLETHDGDRMERLSAQLIVRGAYPAARLRAQQIYDALDGTRNVTVVA